MQNINIDQEILAKIRLNPHYQKYIAQRAEYIRKGEIMKAMQMTERIKKLEKRSYEIYLKQFKEHKVQVATLLETMPEHDKEMLSVLGDSLVMLADVLETLVIEVNQVIERNHPTFRIEHFDKLTELGKEAKKQIRMLDMRETEQYYINLYGDTVDNLTEMIINKARSFVTKIKKHEERTSKKKTDGNKRRA